MLPSNIEPKCDQCGLCCRGYTFWMTNRSFDDDPKEIKKLIEYHGLTTMKNKQGELGIHIPSDCIHYEMVDGKSSCKIHDTKPVVCREYYCEKIIKKALEEANGLCV
jgi:Fe-S-cluster containining protein